MKVFPGHYIEISTEWFLLKTISSKRVKNPLYAVNVIIWESSPRKPQFCWETESFKVTINWENYYMYTLILNLLVFFLLTAICVWWVFFIKFYYFIVLNKLHGRKSNVEFIIFTSLSELCKSCPDFSLVWKNYTWSFKEGMSKVLGSYLLEKFANYQWRKANLSLAFICWENPRRSGILLFPDFHRFCWLMKTQNHRYPQLPGMVWNNSRELRVFLFSWHIPDFC